MVSLLRIAETYDVAFDMILDSFANRHRYVIEAIREFLDIDGQINYNLRYSGFVVDRNLGRRYWIPYRIDHPESIGFRAYREPAHDDNWWIKVDAMN